MSSHVVPNPPPYNEKLTGRSGTIVVLDLIDFHCVGKMNETFFITAEFSQSYGFETT